MWFWGFMTFITLLIPVMMILLGKHVIDNESIETNDIFGYRTSMSLKNKNTWKFAQHLFGKLWLFQGSSMLIISIVLMLFVVKKDTAIVGTLGGIICAIQFVFLLSSILFIEVELRTHFDKKGNKKKLY